MPNKTLERFKMADVKTTNDDKSDFEKWLNEQGIKKKTWEEFRNIGLLWWVNRILHLFGWAICIYADKDEQGNLKILDVFPARVKFRGFSEESETKNFKKLTEYLAKECKNLLKEVED